VFSSLTTVNSTILLLYHREFHHNGVKVRAGLLGFDGAPATALNLNGNKLCDGDIIFLASGLLRNTDITSVDLRNNSLGDRGASYLGGVYVARFSAEVYTR
jgi:hypothetical protein